MTYRTVRAIGLRMPGVVESTMYGSPALKLGGTMICGIAVNKSVEPNTLVVRTTFEQRDLLISEQPEIYYTKDHYRDYPSVLVRLPRVSPAAIRDLLAGACQLVGKRTKRTRSR